MRISADILTLMEEHSLIQTIFDSENTGLELYYIGNHAVKRVVYFLNHINQQVGR